MSRARAVSAVLVVASALLAGCAGSAGADEGSGTASGSSAAASSTSSSSTSSSPSGPAATGGSDRPDDGTTEASSFPANADPDTADASADAYVTVRDIRTGRHDGFDRVVVEVGGTGTPGWDVRYVEQAASQGSGDPVKVAGAAVLQVTITGAGLPSDTGVQEFDGPSPMPGSGTETVTEVVFDHTFEGTAVAFVGTTAEVPFRVYSVSNPTRVVLEVRDA